MPETHMSAGRIRAEIGKNPNFRNVYHTWRTARYTYRTINPKLVVGELDFRNGRTMKSASGNNTIIRATVTRAGAGIEQ